MMIYENTKQYVDALINGKVQDGDVVQVTCRFNPVFKQLCVEYGEDGKGHEKPHFQMYYRVGTDQYMFDRYGEREVRHARISNGERVIVQKAARGLIAQWCKDNGVTIDNATEDDLLEVQRVLFDGPGHDWVPDFAVSYGTGESKVQKAVNNERLSTGLNVLASVGIEQGTKIMKVSGYNDKLIQEIIEKYESNQVHTVGTSG